MKRAVLSLLMLTSLVVLAGCSDQTQVSKQDEIPFSQGQYYAAAYLGYQQIDDLDYYAQQYLDSDQLPIHYLSNGDYYLVIPRYEGMHLALYRNDLESGEAILFYEEPNAGPFILQCNVSDIFPDAVIRLTYGEETVTFSPFLSLKDGSVDIGDQGLDLTRSPSAPAGE